MQTFILSLAIVLGVFSISALVFCLLAYALIRHYDVEPEYGSNEALKNWLLSNPGADIDDYLHNKPDRCVIR